GPHECVLLASPPHCSSKSFTPQEVRLLPLGGRPLRGPAVQVGADPQVLRVRLDLLLQRRPLMEERLVCDIKHHSGTLAFGDAQTRPDECFDDEALRPVKLVCRYPPPSRGLTGERDELQQRGEHPFVMTSLIQLASDLVRLPDHRASNTTHRTIG